MQLRSHRKQKQISMTSRPRGAMLLPSPMEMEVDEEGSLPWVRALVSADSFDSREPLRSAPELSADTIVPELSMVPELSAHAMAQRLTVLVSTDPALFLERYGNLLRADQLCMFDGIAGSYEVTWHQAPLCVSHAAPARPPHVPCTMPVHPVHIISSHYLVPRSRGT